MGYPNDSSGSSEFAEISASRHFDSTALTSSQPLSNASFQVRNSHLLPVPRYNMPALKADTDCLPTIPNYGPGFYRCGLRTIESHIVDFVAHIYLRGSDQLPAVAESLIV